jgi:glycosyltransferase involved in cell wall biosynthesis
VRLVHLAHYPARYPGSFVPMLQAVLRAARARGWEVEVGLADDARGCDWVDDLGVPVRFFELRGRRRLRRELGALLSASEEPTILHTHFTAFDVPAVLAARRRPGAAVVWHLHSPARTDLVGRVRGFAKSGLAARLADRILCVSPDRAEAAVAQGAPRNRVRFFPNAVDASAFAPASADERRAAREELGLPPEGVVLLHFGWDWERKGGDVYAEAVRRLRGGGRAVTAATVGGEGDGLVPLPAGLRVQTLYAAADVFVSPSRAEGMPFAVLEALASGLPVAGSDIPGQAAVGRGLGACRLVQLEPQRLADAIASLLDRDPDAAERDAREATERVRTEYDLAPWAERLLGVYAEIAPTSSR